MTSGRSPAPATKHPKSATIDDLIQRLTSGIRDPSPTRRVLEDLRRRYEAGISEEGIDDGARFRPALADDRRTD